MSDDLIKLARTRLRNEAMLTMNKDDPMVLDVLFVLDALQVAEERAERAETQTRQFARAADTEKAERQRLEAEVQRLRELLRTAKYLLLKHFDDMNITVADDAARFVVRLDAALRVE